jgi:hypothetical protein
MNVVQFIFSGAVHLVYGKKAVGGAKVVKL